MRKAQLEILTMLLYLAMIFLMDKEQGAVTVARGFKAYANGCRAVGTWFLTQAIRADNTYRGLIAP